MNVLEMFEVQLLDVLPKFTGGALPTSKQGSKESSDRWVRADTSCHCTTKSRGESPRPTSPCHVEEASSTSCPQPAPTIPLGFVDNLTFQALSIVPGAVSSPTNPPHLVREYTSPLSISTRDKSVL